MLDHILREGDRVRMKMDSESRNWGKKNVPDGTLGTVVGRFRVTDIIENRYPRHIREPGVYAKDCGPIVMWDEYPDGMNLYDPEVARPAATWLEPADTFFKEYQTRYATEWPVRLDNGKMNPEFCIIKEGDRLDNMERTGDLPETEFWELDIVSYKGKRYQIFRINYNRWGPGKNHCYDMEEADENNQSLRNGSTTVDPNQLVLVERGNVWKEAHGEPLIFHSLQEESSYAKAMGRTTSVRNPANNLYVWSLEQILEAIKNGIVDGFTNDTIPFSSNRHINATRFNDRDLGQRVAEATLKGFDLKGYNVGFLKTD